MKLLRLLPLLTVVGCEIRITPLPLPEDASSEPVESGVTTGDTSTPNSDTSSSVTSADTSTIPEIPDASVTTTDTSGNVPPIVDGGDASVIDGGTSLGDTSSTDVLTSDTSNVVTLTSTDVITEVSSGTSEPGDTTGVPDNNCEPPCLTPPLPPPPSVPAAVAPLASGCGITPQRCPQSGVLPSGAACDLFGSDWWPNKAADQAGTHHVPAGTALQGFRAEHITPYGGWFTFTSPWSSMWNDDYAVCWSELELGLETIADLDAALADNRCVRTQVLTREGILVKPVVVNDLEPSTTYYFRAVYTPTWPALHASDPASDVVSFTTLPDPTQDLVLGAHPRLAVTADKIQGLKDRYLANDARIDYWLGLDDSKLIRAYSPTGGVYLPEQFGVLGALKWHLTDDVTHRDGALVLLGQLLDIYEGALLTGNQYRWQGADLAMVTDLMWDELTLVQKQRILDAMLEEDEHVDNMFPRFEDTDQQVAFAWIQISHALLFMNDPDLEPTSVARMGAVFEHAIRRWYGTFHPKMRRADKIFGIAGGEMDDGTDYARGTQGYFLETMLFLDNNGMSQADYSEWVWNHFQTHSIYGLLPDRSGAVTWGDVESGDILPNGGQAINKENWSYEALHICLLREYCRDTEAGYVRDTLLNVWDPSDDWGPHHWAVLCDDDAVVPQDYTTLPLMYHSEGLGNVHDRTGWGTSDSFLFFGAGWRAVDHNHDDAGHFSLWSNGAFVAHEIPEYDENSDSHNVLLMGLDSQDYLWKRGSDSTIVSTSTSANHFFVLADLTSGYNFDHNHPGYGSIRTIHDEVTRSLFWDKLTDRVVVYDRVVGGPGTHVPTQNFLGTAVVTELYNEDADDVIELLSIVNGTGDLAIAEDAIGVDNLVIFNRETGQLQ